MSNVIPLGNTYNAAQAQNALYNRNLQLAAQQNSQLGNIQQQAAQMAAWGAQQHAQQQALKRARYMIDGRPMELQEFVDTLFPDDCPEKTYLLLKLSKGEDNE